VKLTSFFLLVLCASFSLTATAEQILVAVAANFLRPMEAVVAEFEAQTDHRVILTSGSSGKLFAQLRHGAPFDLFFSADQSKPAALVQAGLAVAESRFTYSLGNLVLWSPRPGFVSGPETLDEGEFNRLAIANPRVAPYGQAAMEALETLGVLSSLRHKLVQGESVAQSFQFVATGNAELGLVAASQVLGREGSGWRVPGHLHRPIRQDAVLLQSAGNSATAREFLWFIRSDQAREIIEAHGYGVEDRHPGTRAIGKEQ
jgi:molybdate transport system substrate-binding protein